jgi:hypothetical protein
MRMTLLSLALLGLAACQAEAPSDTSPDVADDAPPTASAPAPAAMPPEDDSDGTDAPDGTAADPASVLAGKVWRVERRSDGGEIGATYAFLADGTLVVDSPNGTPTAGAWQVRDGALSMTEEGVSYPTDLIVRDASHVTLRSRNPGGVVELALVAAPDVPLPQ